MISLLLMFLLQSGEVFVGARTFGDYPYRDVGLGGVDLAKEKLLDGTLVLTAAPESKLGSAVAYVEGLCVANEAAPRYEPLRKQFVVSGRISSATFPLRDFPGCRDSKNHIFVLRYGRDPESPSDTSPHGLLVGVQIRATK